MQGFIGLRARRKKRNIIIFFVLIIIFLLFIYIIPFFKLTEAVPSDTLLPGLKEPVSSKFELTINELEFKIIDKEQKINFRNKEIIKINEELRILVKENKQLSNSILDLKNQLSLDSSGNEEIKNLNSQLKKNKNQLQELDDIILIITNEKDDLFKNLEKISLENEILNREYKIIANKNIKLTNLKNLLEKKIKEQIFVIDELNILNQTLKDNYHHR